MLCFRQGSQADLSLPLIHFDQFFLLLSTKAIVHDIPFWGGTLQRRTSFWWEVLHFKPLTPTTLFNLVLQGSHSELPLTRHLPFLPMSFLSLNFSGTHSVLALPFFCRKSHLDPSSFYLPLFQTFSLLQQVLVFCWDHGSEKRCFREQPHLSWDLW